MVSLVGVASAILALPHVVPATASASSALPQLSPETTPPVSWASRDLRPGLLRAGDLRSEGSSTEGRSPGVSWSVTGAHAAFPHVAGRQPACGLAETDADITQHSDDGRSGDTLRALYRGDSGHVQGIWTTITAYPTQAGAVSSLRETLISLGACGPRSSFTWDGTEVDVTYPGGAPRAQQRRSPVPGVQAFRWPVHSLGGWHDVTYAYGLDANVVLTLQVTSEDGRSGEVADEAFPAAARRLHALLGSSREVVQHSADPRSGRDGG